jgi:hypothetical protein
VRQGQSSTRVTGGGSSPRKGSAATFPRDSGEAGGSTVVELEQRVTGESSAGGSGIFYSKMIDKNRKITNILLSHF